VSGTYEQSKFFAVPDRAAPESTSVDRLVRKTARRLLQSGVAPTHLDLAVAALGLAGAADRLARVEVIAARNENGATWEDVGDALGVSRQTAHERFRAGPDGLHSRFFKSSPQRPAETALKASRSPGSKVVAEPTRRTRRGV
jgi:hypothetical protein